MIDLIPATPHLIAIKSILEAANIDVVLETRLDPRDDDQWLAELNSLYNPSLIIHSLDRRMLAHDTLSSSYPASIVPDIPIIVAAQNADAAEIRTQLELGVADFITPPFTSANILPRVWRLLRHNAASAETNVRLQEKLAVQRLGLVGESPCFLEEIRKLRLLARCDITVMIGGETGTGKELIARAVHYLSSRSDGPFVPIDCGAIPPELTESELFGHERGAFTGAVARNLGLVSAADQGTLFLDEVDALNLSVQAKILRFLQEMEYRPLGSNKIKKADVRVISATNRNLKEQVRNNEFREDLYYRLNVVQLKLPGLRDRSNDVILLARHFAHKYAARFHRPLREFSRGALQKLLLYQWPGNIRELENVVEGAVALCDGPVIRVGDLLLPEEQSAKQLSFREAKAQMVSKFEREYLVRLVRACGGNVSEAARTAGKNRRALWALIRKHELDVRELRDGVSERLTAKPSVRAPLRASTSARSS